MKFCEHFAVNIVEAFGGLKHRTVFYSEPGAITLLEEQLNVVVFFEESASLSHLSDAGYLTKKFGVEFLEFTVETIDLSCFDQVDNYNNEAN